MWAIEQNDTLKQLTKLQVEKIVTNTTIVNYKKNDIIFSKGEIPSKLIFILEGSISKV